MNEDDIFGNGGNGTLDASISRSVENDNDWDENKGDKWINISLDDKDLLSIHSETFRNVFNKEPEIEFFFIKNWESVKNQINDTFPMLSKIDNVYKDATFLVNEVENLQNECFKLKSITTDKSADLAFRKLIYSCDEAIKSNLCLGLWCD